MSFVYNERNPLDAGCVIVDEVSMIDVFLMSALLRALRQGTRLVLVGDKDQLPSVGAGNVLADILSSKKIPATYLDVIFRQAESSQIIYIRVGEGDRVVLHKNGKSADDWWRND